MDLSMKATIKNSSDRLAQPQLQIQSNEVKPWLKALLKMLSSRDAVIPDDVAILSHMLPPGSPAPAQLRTFIDTLVERGDVRRIYLGREPHLAKAAANEAFQKKPAIRLVAVAGDLRKSPPPKDVYQKPLTPITILPMKQPLDITQEGADAYSRRPTERVPAAGPGLGWLQVSIKPSQGESQLPPVLAFPAARLPLTQHDVHSTWRPGAYEASLCPLFSSSPDYSNEPTVVLSFWPSDDEHEVTLQDLESFRAQSVQVPSDPDEEARQATIACYRDEIRALLNEVSKRQSAELGSPSKIDTLARLETVSALDETLLRFARPKDLRMLAASTTSTAAVPPPPLPAIYKDGKSEPDKAPATMKTTPTDALPAKDPGSKEPTSQSSCAPAQPAEEDPALRAKVQSLALEVDTEHERSVLYRVAIVAELVCLLMLVRSFVMIWLER
jgi:hypothetical protein